MVRPFKGLNKLMELMPAELPGEEISLATAGSQGTSCL